MVAVKITKRGDSFKGALSYYLHDKKQEGEVERLTSERVDWTVTRGFHNDNVDPDLAGRIMAATAMDQNRLKEQAGVRKSGQKSKGAVYAYSIAWHPDEAGKIDKAEMLKAADQSLKAIGAQDHQTIIVAHNDEPHPHVHVIVNLVSLQDGRNLTLKKDYNKLSDWGLAYRKERGEEELYCPKRNERAKAIQKKRAGEKVDFVVGEKSRPRGLENDFSKAKAANENETLSEHDRQKQKAAALSLQSKSQVHRHRREWVDLGDKLKFKKRDINTQATDAIDRAKEQIDKKFEPHRRDLHSTQYKEKQFFEKRENRLWGKVENAVLVIAHRRQIDPDGSRGFMADAFNFLTSKKARAEALDKLHRTDQRNLTKAQRDEVGAAVSAINTDKSALLSQADKIHLAERKALIESQTAEKKEIRIRWKQLNEERKRAFKIIKEKAEFKRSAKAEVPEDRRKPRRDFKRAAEGEKRRRRSRGRVRKRTIDDE